MAKETTFEHPPRGHTAILAYDAANDVWRAVYVDASGNLQVDVVASGLPSDAATETTLAKVSDRLGALTGPAAGSANKQLADLLTELGAKLETADLNLDATKDLQVDVKTAPTITVIPGSSEKLIGYGGLIGENLSDTSLDAGTNSLIGTAVPAGEVHVVTQVAVLYTGTVPTKVLIAPVGTPGTPVYLEQWSPASGQWYYSSINVLLQEGDYIGCTVTGATAGDDLFFRYSGYKFAPPA